MYTHDDYLKDVYIREHGSGVEQWEADMRCRDYEHGRDPETAPASRKARAEKHKARWKPIFFALLIITIVVYVVWNLYFMSNDVLEKVVYVLIGATVLCGIWTFL